MTVHLSHIEAENDSWKCCGWKRVNLIEVVWHINTLGWSNLEKKLYRHLECTINFNQLRSNIGFLMLANADLLIYLLISIYM